MGLVVVVMAEAQAEEQQLDILGGVDGGGVQWQSVYKEQDNLLVPIADQADEEHEEEVLPLQDAPEPAVEKRRPTVSRW